MASSEPIVLTSVVGDGLFPDGYLIKRVKVSKDKKQLRVEFVKRNYTSKK